MSEKLQKVLSRAGLGSRRGIEKMIAEGRIAVGGEIAKIGERVDADAVTVTLDGRVVFSPETSRPKCRVLMYHKPEGELTTQSDPEGRPTVFDHLPRPDSGRWIYVGRLDINTSGLLLFTNDGDLANALTHPRQGIERVYAARIYGEVSEEMIHRLESGVELEDGPARFDKVTFAGGEARNAWYHVSLKEGRKREVRRLWEAAGVRVSRLIRVSFGGVALDPALKAGQCRELTLEEINRLRSLASLAPLTPEDLPDRPLAVRRGRSARRRPEGAGRERWIHKGRGSGPGAERGTRAGSAAFREASGHASGPWKQERRSRTDRDGRPGSGRSPYAGGEKSGWQERRARESGNRRPDGEHRSSGRPDAGSPWSGAPRKAGACREQRRAPGERRKFRGRG